MSPHTLVLGELPNLERAGYGMGAGRGMAWENMYIHGGNII